jgi:hypothetical protein
MNAIAEAMKTIRNSRIRFNSVWLFLDGRVSDPRFTRKIWIRVSGRFMDFQSVGSSTLSAIDSHLHGLLEKDRPTYTKDASG